MTAWLDKKCVCRKLKDEESGHIGGVLWLPLATAQTGYVFPPTEEVFDVNLKRVRLPMGYIRPQGTEVFDVSLQRVRLLTRYISVQGTEASPGRAG